MNEPENINLLSDNTLSTRQKRGFSLQLFWVILLPLIAFLLVVVFSSYSLHHQAMRTLVGDRDLRAVRAAARSLSEQLAHLEFSLKALSLSVQQGTDINPPNETIRLLATPFDGGVALFAADGTQLYASQPQPYLDQIAKNLPAFWAEIHSAPSQEVILSQAIPNRGTYIILLGTALPDDRVLVGVFFPAALAQRSLAELGGEGQVTLLVIDQNLNILYHLEGLVMGDNLASHTGVAEALRGESGINYFAAGHDHHVVAFSPVTPPGWALVIIESWEESAGSLLTTTQAAPLILIPVLFFVLAVLWFGARQIVQPILKLRSQAAELGRGNFAAIEEPVGGINEVRGLQAELAGMAVKLKTAQENLRHYIGAITSGIENERRSLARELHDDTLQSLIALNQQVQLLTHKVTTRGSPATPHQDLQKSVRQAIENLRRMTRGLRPPYLEDLGLAAALNMLKKEIRDTTGLEVKFTDLSQDQRLPADVENSLFRIAQEALNNALRHAQASQLEIFLAIEPREVKLVIRDNGRGFIVPDHPEQGAAQGHFGILGMVERAELAGLELNIESTPGIGSEVQVLYKVGSDTNQKKKINE
jgi:signal transduction histidine kinase